MWNSSREIQPDERLATQAPPPPYVLPPNYAEVGEIEAVEEVVHPEHFPVETIEIDPSTLEEVHNNHPSHSFGPSWAFLSTNTQAQNPAASEHEAAENPTSYENETGDVSGAGDENPNVEPQLSEKARGKKRMREEDETDDSEALEQDLGGGCSSGSGTIARMGLFETLTDVESCRQVKKLKEIEKLYRSGRLLA
ncbi:hypothetical protein BGY98DRAFT_985034 [Russula aff. rugulosa BPL654]|nr:hypothetical protein BGY98DRAFT_985034 [Russula aff. rugulosa BPL654]